MRIAGKVTMVSVVLVAAATLSACANSEQASTGTLPTAESTPPPTTKTSAKATSTTAPGNTATGPECTAEDIKVDGDFGAKPTITIPKTCQPPKKLLSKDLKPGTGAAVAANSNVSVNYLLQTWSDNNIVDNSYDRGKPLDVEALGQSTLIQGWKQGLVGAKEGGRRLLVVPSDLGYGPNGRAPIKGGETLVFVVDTVKVS
ncbi:hypothetical protein ALI144C_39265 [Actinosynnema sp. ALI-1.44]|uniref:FKBP-type peptidyl-prolyl cis-trans isomerase n=1 Tax=Actinosynnema sp. ALI-1.44 TaxID=1933779 RepID=UPI00097C7763|nr:FKBP-type peptidyl-prolyl cis-trans isomerase [Actinosynnema sp. ALI-1.44]ONI74835.1 hypothetical protein ALI144C_39265 [Actinosynnema sp. ALI-1.44]